MVDSRSDDDTAQLMAVRAAHEVRSEAREAGAIDRRTHLANERAARRERHRIAAYLGICLALGVGATVLVVNLAR